MYQLQVLFLLGGLSLSGGSIFAQALAIRNPNGAEMYVEADGLEYMGYRLQTSSDFTTWIDISDQTAGPLSFRIDAITNSASFFRLRTWLIDDASIFVAMVGDSTVASLEADGGVFAGWGQGIPALVKPNVRTVNYAVSFQSTKTFLTSIELNNLLKVKPDFVLIQFGWVDAAIQSVLYTTIPEYEENLKKIVQLVRSINGTPILVTPTGPRYFDGNGKIIAVIEDRCQAVRRAAAATQAYLIDLNPLLTNLYNEWGPDKSIAEIASNPDDGAHFSLNGADIVAGLVVSAFPPILRPQLKP